MIYNNSLPRINNVLWLARLSMPFPASAGAIIEIAEAWHFDKSTLDFLDLFPRDVVFETRKDFLTRCEDLELLLREEAEAPAETVLSPQD
jgi:hypothetical protein